MVVQLHKPNLRRVRVALQANHIKSHRPAGALLATHWAVVGDATKLNRRHDDNSRDNNYKNSGTIDEAARFK